ncbi:hypothetical protein BD560DRAFT_401998 [Blakeslea trispora]|nr:hypothetical protein BD560DRAFT_401998 [Blakeslea trispora]
MFQSKKYIEQRHGKESANRKDHLKSLVQEYKVTQDQGKPFEISEDGLMTHLSLEAKQQILANLANFAYDPINYDTLWDLQVIQLFLDALQESHLREFGMGGIANICLEPRHQQYLQSFLKLMVDCLKPTCTPNTQLNAMTALMQLVTQENYTVLLTLELKEHLKHIRTNRACEEASIMATLFLVDYYHEPF